MLKNLHGGLNVRKYVWRLKHLKNDMEAEMGETEYGSLNPRNYIWWLKCSWLPMFFPNVMHTSIETVPTCHNLCNGLLLLRSPQIAFMSVNNTTPLLLPLCLLIRYNCALCTCLTQPSDQVYTSNWFDASHISARVSEYIRCVVMKCWYFFNLLKLHLHAF